MKTLILSFFIILLFNSSAASETLNLATVDYYPTMYMEGDQLKGVAVDIVKEAFKRMGQEITITMFPFKRGLLMLENGDVDGMFTLYKTKKRTAFVFYPEVPILIRTISFYVRKDSPITYNGDIGSMLKYSIGIIFGYSYGKELDKYLNDGAFEYIDGAAGLENTIKKLVVGRLELMPHTRLDMIPLLKKMKLQNEVKELTPAILENPVYIGFNKKKEKLAALAVDFSNTIVEMKKDGTYEKLYYSIE